MSDILECEILAITTDKHHGTQIMMKTEHNGCFFVGLNEVFYLWKREKPQEFADNPHDWSEIQDRELKGQGVRMIT